MIRRGPIGYALATLIALAFPSAALVVFLFLNVFYLWPRKRAELVVSEAT